MHKTYIGVPAQLLAQGIPELTPRSYGLYKKEHQQSEAGIPAGACIAWNREATPRLHLR